MVLLLVIFAIWVITGFAIARYVLKVSEILALIPVSMGAGFAVYFWLINILLRTQETLVIAWAVIAVMLAISGVLWRFQRDEVEPLHLAYSRPASLAIAGAAAALGLFLTNLRVVRFVYDETQHFPLAAMVARVGLPGLTIPSYADPRLCLFYHYGIDAVIGVLYRQTGMLLPDLNLLITIYLLFALVGLAVLFVQLLIGKQSVAWPLLGVFLFSFAGSGRWLTMLYFVQPLQAWLQSSNLTRIWHMSRAVRLDALSPSQNWVWVFNLPADFMVSFSFTVSWSLSASFWVIALLAWTGWLSLRAGKAWYWYMGVGLLVGSLAAFSETTTPLIALPIGLDLVWQVWAARKQPLPALRNLLLFAVPGLLAIVLQGGIITDSLFCKVPWKAMFSGTDTGLAEGGNLTDFRIKDEVGYYKSLWSPSLVGNVIHPQDWGNVLVDWGFPFVFFPALLIYAIATRQSKLALILACGLPMVVLPFVFVNQGESVDSSRFTVPPLWVASMASVVLLERMWRLGRGAGRVAARIFVVGFVIVFTLTEFMNGLATLGKPPSATYLLGDLDVRVHNDWASKIDTHLDAVYDPGRELGGYSQGVARSITVFETYGRLNGTQSISAIFVGFTPGVTQWWDTGSAAALIGDGFDYLFIDDDTWTKLTPLLRQSIADSHAYPLVQEWTDENGHYRRLYRLPYQAAAYRLGDGLTVVGLNVPKSASSPGSLMVGARLIATRSMPEDYIVFFHLKDAQGKLVAQSDSRTLGANWTTSTMPVGYAGGVSRILDIPAGLPAGTYTLLMGAYRYPSIERLPAFASDGQPFTDNLIELGQITISAAP